MEAVHIFHRGLFFPSGRLTARRETELIVLHHTGGVKGEDPDVAAIDAAHRRLGWAGVGYHYLIRKSGAVEAGRPDFAVGAHAEGGNRASIGIALGGNFCEEAPTAAQTEATAMLLAVLSAAFGVALDGEHVVGHRDLDATACPGDALYERLEEIIGKANWYRMND